jgi:hypothetical protein
VSQLGPRVRVQTDGGFLLPFMRVIEPEEGVTWGVIRDNVCEVIYGGGAGICELNSLFFIIDRLCPVSRHL